MNKNREYRAMEMRLAQEGEYIVEGYASTFEPYCLYSFDGVDYFEQIDRSAFDEADFTDVVFRVDHEGKVYARSSNGLVDIKVDEHGLFQRTDLSKTQASRDLYEEIKCGNYPKMSFCFSVREDSYDRETHTRTILKIDKVYDVAPVAFPANPTTELSARSYFDGVIEMERTERCEREKALNNIKRTLLLERIKHEKS